MDVGDATWMVVAGEAGSGDFALEAGFIDRARMLDRWRRSVGWRFCVGVLFSPSFA